MLANRLNILLPLLFLLLALLPAVHPQAVQPLTTTPVAPAPRTSSLTPFLTNLLNPSLPSACKTLLATTVSGPTAPCRLLEPFAAALTHTDLGVVVGQSTTFLPGLCSTACGGEVGNIQTVCGNGSAAGMALMGDITGNGTNGGGSVLSGMSVGGLLGVVEYMRTALCVVADENVGTTAGPSVSLSAVMSSPVASAQQQQKQQQPATGSPTTNVTRPLPVGQSPLPVPTPQPTKYCIQFFAPYLPASTNATTAGGPLCSLPCTPTLLHNLHDTSNLGNDVKPSVDAAVNGFLDRIGCEKAATTNTAQVNGGVGRAQVHVKEVVRVVVGVVVVGSLVI